MEKEKSKVQESEKTNSLSVAEPIIETMFSSIETELEKVGLKVGRCVWLMNDNMVSCGIICYISISFSTPDFNSGISIFVRFKDEDKFIEYKPNVFFDTKEELLDFISKDAEYFNRKIQNSYGNSYIY